MVNYETLMLVRTEITGDELSALERSIDKLVSGQKGRMTLFDKWGKYKLAYPVQKNVYGIYLLARYEAPRENLKALFKDIDTLFRIKYNEVVMRHVTMHLEGEVSSVYKHPEPIGQRGSSNLDSFIKENKMEGLIETPVEKSKKAKTESSASKAASEEKTGAPVEAPAEEPAVEDKTESSVKAESATTEEEN